MLALSAAKARCKVHKRVANIIKKRRVKPDPCVCVCFVLYLDWTGLDEDEDAHVWEDNWDDDNVEDDFSNQLRYSGPILKFSRPNSQIEFFS